MKFIDKFLTICVLMFVLYFSISVNIIMPFVIDFFVKSHSMNIFIRYGFEVGIGYMTGTTWGKILFKDR